MKIAVILDSLKKGGAERQALLSVSELSRLGHHAEIIVYYSHREYADIIERDDIKVMQISSRFGKIGRVIALARYLKKEKFQVVHAFGGTANFYSSIAARLASVPAIFAGFRGQMKNSALLSCIYKVVDKLVCGWIVNSNAIIESLNKAIGVSRERCFVVYNGVPVGNFKTDISKKDAMQKLGVPQGHNVIINVARLHPVKNHKLLLDSASIVLKSHPETTFLIVGQGQLREDLEKHTESLRISDNVLFLGERSDIPIILAAADISILTSDFEGFPNTLLEAMAVGLPVVSTDYPGVEELITDGVNGFVAPTNSQDKVANVICKLLDNPELRKTIGQDNSEMIREKYGPKKMADNLLSIYKIKKQK